jgi:hypothetical protein
MLKSTISCAGFKKNILKLSQKIQKSENLRGLKGAKQKYSYSEGRQVKRYKVQRKFRGLKGTSEDISITRRKQSQKVQGRTESKYTKKPQSKCTQEKNPSQKCTLEEKNPSLKAQEKPQSSSQKVQRGKQVKRCKSELM